MMTNAKDEHEHFDHAIGVSNRLLRKLLQRRRIEIGLFYLASFFFCSVAAFIVLRRVGLATLISVVHVIITWCSHIVTNIRSSLRPVGAFPSIFSGTISAEITFREPTSTSSLYEAIATSTIMDRIEL